ncbi:hypothetical protein OG864_45060 [Streptomyces sp. NBC_00124]|uniref:hypothetical protein n=1 Tax=Streptomyces sp. NBC_00124 TaxID=2975662 RepID=UPI00225A6CC9|nr:hypothetical protein [Streptomyces sp. NBC_00124]MCX5365872.1 hypothetical protein [Streptomyces sp. NBC_00124]
MTELTPEQAKARASRILDRLHAATITDWNEAVLDQVVLHLGRTGRPLSMNDVRLIVPETAYRNAGLYFRSLAELEHPTVLRVVGEVVSSNPKAHGKRVNVYTLTASGRKHLENRIAARMKQRKAAAA